MKKILLSLSFLLIIAAVYPQAPFVGKITHKMTSNQENMVGTIEIFYGEQKIRAVKKIEGGKEFDDADMVVDFFKGIVYHMNTALKTYRADTIKSNSFHRSPKFVAVAAKNTTLLNHQCSAFTVIDKNAKGLMDDMDFVFWYADSLYFPVYDDNFLFEETALFTNGKHIGMGITINMQLGDKKLIAAISPVTIEPRPVPDSLFEIPKDYVLETTSQYIMADTAVIQEIDGLKANPVPKKPIKKTVPQSNKKKVPVQRTATRPKE
jgi:hypothetical protein